MRVLFANLYWDPAWSTPRDAAGGDRIRGPLARALAALGHAVTIVQDAPFDAEFIDGVSPHVNWIFVRPEAATRAVRSLAARANRPFPGAHTRPGRFVLRVASEAEKVDVIHGFDLCAYPTVNGLGEIATGQNIPLVLHFHGGAPPKSPVGRRAARIALGAATAALFTTRTHAEPFLQAGLLNPAQVHEVNELSSTFSFAPVRTSSLAGNPAVLSVGRLESVKDPLTTVAGFAHFRERVPSAHLHLVYATHALLPQVRGRVSALHLDSAVTIHGVVPTREVERMLGAADLFVLSSVREVCGTALLEALAVGCAPVVSDIPAFRHVLGTEFGSQLFPVGRSEALGEVLARTWDNMPSRAIIRAHFDSTCSYEVLARALAALYAELSAEGF